jgi:hypothetical protein
MTGLYVKTDFEVQMKILNISIQILALSMIVILPDTFVKITKKEVCIFFLKLNMT